MYPYLRMIRQLWAVRKAPPLGIFGTHVTQHICLPWDLDPWMELNNGRTLTLMDLGRIPLTFRTGFVDVLRREKWGMTMAGVSVRYRKRIRMFDRFETRSQCVGWDERFFYIVQSMWRGDTCCNEALYRSAVTSSAGMVAPARVADAFGQDANSPALPAWVQAWIEAEAVRPWPPEDQNLGQSLAAAG